MDSLELIRTFREVATRGSFSKAADALNLSRANTSKYVAALEEKLGVRLLNRSTRSVSLTDAGELLLERSAPLMDLVSLARDDMAERANQPTGRVHISAPYVFGDQTLAGLLAEFSRHYPKVHVSVTLTNRRVDLVEEAVDLVLRVGRIEDSELIVKRLQPVPMVVVAAPGYWVTHGRPQTPEDLIQHQCLTYSLGKGGGIHPEWRFQRDGKPVDVAVHGPMDASDGQVLLSFAQAGLGVVYLPELLAKEALAHRALEPVLQQFVPTDTWLYMAYAQRKHNSAALRTMLAFLSSRLMTPTTN